jgi:hypothetical protein
MVSADDVDLSAELFTVEEVLALLGVGDVRGRSWIASNVPVVGGLVRRSDLETLAPSVWRLIVIAAQQRAPAPRKPR